MINPPRPKKIKKLLTAHNDERLDWYYWLRDDKRKNKEVLNYLRKRISILKIGLGKIKLIQKKYFWPIEIQFQKMKRV